MTRTTIRSAALAVMMAAVSWGVAAAAPPGVVIDHQLASTGQYVGSPSLAVLEDGTYVASHDLFGPKSPKAAKAKKTRIFVSKDRGASWKKVATLDAFWSGLFVHKGALYLMGVSNDYGHVAIRRSEDGGRTWTTPDSPSTGLLLSDARYHTATMPVLVHGGRIWRTMEDREGPGKWGTYFRSFVMSAPVDADLLDAKSWTRTESIGRDPAWLGGDFLGWLEGNPVATPEGEVVNILRVHTLKHPERAAVIRISKDGTKGEFDPETGFIEFPGGAKKFNIRFDEPSGMYWSLVNYVPEAFREAGQPDRVRNTVALVASKDLKAWEVRSIVLHHPEVKRHGFQYLDWRVEGEDIVAVSRTAYDDEAGGADNYHNANYLTFHRFEKFRTLSMKDSVPVGTPTIGP